MLFNLNLKMGSESENLDRCFEVVSAVVEKAGDVNIFKQFLIETVQIITL